MLEPLDLLLVEGVVDQDLERVRALVDPAGGDAQGQRHPGRQPRVWRSGGQPKDVQPRVRRVRRDGGQLLGPDRIFLWKFL